MTHLQLLALVIPYSGNTKVRCDAGSSFDTFHINKCNFGYPFLHLLGVLSGVKATLRLLTFVIPYSRTLRYDMTLVLPLPFYINTCTFCYPFLLPLLGLLSGVKPHLKLLALVIPYSGNPKVRYDLVISLGPFYINKSQFCYHCFLLTSKGDFGVKAPPQTCQRSIFGILMAPQINPWGQTFWPS